MERFLDRIGVRKNIENKIDINFSREALAYLKKLITRPNPNLAEFAFLGLGRDGFIDQILAADEYTPATEEELNENKKILNPRVSRNELAQLFSRLGDINRIEDFLILGHSHPMGAKEVDGRYYWIAPSNALLEPSMGSPNEGGPGGAHDVGFLKDFYESVVNVPYAGIIAITGTGPKLRLYKIEELIKIKKYNDIDKVPQITIKL